LNLGEGSYSIRCVAVDESFPFVDDEVQTFTITVDREVAITFEPPGDMTVALGNDGGRNIYYRPFVVENAEVACDPAEPVFVTEAGSFTVTCTASNELASTDVVHSFLVTVRDDVLPIGQAIESVTQKQSQGTTSTTFSGTVATAGGTTQQVLLTMNEQGATETPQGQRMQVNGTTAKANTRASVVINSEPYEAGDTIVEPDGSWVIDFAVPSDFPLGEHTMAVYWTDQDDEVQARFVPLEVVERVSPATTTKSPAPITPASAETPELAVDPDGDTNDRSATTTPATTASTSNGLAHTGSESRRFAMVGSLLLAMGFVVLGSVRTRRQRWSPMK